MDPYDDLPENEPRVKSRLPSKSANARALRSSLEYQKPREEFRYRAQHHRNPTAAPANRAGCAASRSITG
jgi:hypothetical protein